MDTLNNTHAQRIAALLRHTVNNPNAPTLAIKYAAWERIQRVLFGNPIALHSSESSEFINDWMALIASISEATGLAVRPEDIAWLVDVISRQDVTTLSVLMAMSSMTPPGDMLSVQEVADRLGHQSTSTLRTWIAEGRYLSAVKISKTWLIAASELDLQ